MTRSASGGAQKYGAQKYGTRKYSTQKYSVQMTPAEAAALLGVGADAGPDEILRAFRHAARASHPDLLVDASPHEVSEAEARFVRVSSARDILLHQTDGLSGGTPADRQTSSEEDDGHGDGYARPGEWFTSPTTGRRVFIAEPEPIPLPPSSWALAGWVALLVAAIALSYLGGPLPGNPFDLLLRMIPLSTFAVLYASTGKRRFLVLGGVWAAVTAALTFVLASFGSLLALEILIVPLLALVIIGNRRRRRSEAEGR